MMKCYCQYETIDVLADFHSHTVYSGHAMASPEEMVKAAANMGLEYIAITDHIYEYNMKSDIENQNFRAGLIHTYLSDKYEIAGQPTKEGIKVIGGGEFNCFTSNPAYFTTPLRLFGYHSWFNPKGELTIDKMLCEYERYSHMEKKPHVFVHPERIAPVFGNEQDGKYFIKNLIILANRYDIKVEINTSSFIYLDSKEKIEEMNMYMDYMLFCIERTNCELTIGSDSHATIDIGINFIEYLRMLKSRHLLDRVINIDADKCERFYNEIYHGTKKA